MTKTTTTSLIERLLAPIVDRMLHDRLDSIHDELDIIGRELTEVHRRLEDLETSIGNGQE
jgi:hypothetical protein